MAKIIFVVPALHRKVFSGGIWCIKEYAQGLAKLGHEVEMLPMLPSPQPEWFDDDCAFRFRPFPVRSQVVAIGRTIGRSAGALLAWSFGKGTREAVRAQIQELVDRLLWIFPLELPHELARAASLRYVATQIGSADAVVATSFETALPVRLYGKGRRFYFAQHFEPLFFTNQPGKDVARLEALLSYRLGLGIIVNSSWLKARLYQEVPEAPVDFCPNAINHELFHGPLKSCAVDERSVKLISYGGRGVAWKGFVEMAEAVALARARLPDWKIEWQVYGSAALPPDNSVASYTPLGFLQPEQLAAAYRGADILLSASWYESFPLFPLEAMACGLPVVTTQPGTEDFAIHGETAEIVEPRNVESIASGLVRLITDLPYRKKLAARGQEMSRKFTWKKSVQTMQEILLGGIEA